MTSSTSPSSNLNSHSETRNWNANGMSMKSSQLRTTLDAKQDGGSCPDQKGPVEGLPPHGTTKDTPSAARKLARRRWDPPKKAPRSQVECSRPVPPASLAQSLGGYSDVQLQDFPDIDVASCPIVAGMTLPFTLSGFRPMPGCHGGKSLLSLWALLREHLGIL
ncbi:hypothetical protein B0H14DRAFT_2659390 [Mycena olivaceomarginata]|nr:hypothetical protein B0H14DRAFT_2659390 [Mycena olivaceomarginata]